MLKNTENILENFQIRLNSVLEKKSFQNQQLLPFHNYLGKRFVEGRAEQGLFICGNFKNHKKACMITLEDPKTCEGGKKLTFLHILYIKLTLHRSLFKASRH